MLAEGAPAEDDSVPGGLLQQISNRYASDKWFADEKNTAAWCLVQRQSKCSG